MFPERRRTHARTQQVTLYIIYIGLQEVSYQSQMDSSSIYRNSKVESNNIRHVDIFGDA
jgi:hypothetical protein